MITDALKGNGVFDIAEYCAEYHSVQEEIKKAKEELLEKLFNDTLLQFSDVQQRAVTRAKDEKISSWLTVTCTYSIATLLFPSVYQYTIPIPIVQRIREIIKILI